MYGHSEVGMTAVATRPGARVAGRLPGLAVTVLVAAVATALGRLVPVVGGPVFAIVVGVLAATVVKPLRSTTLAPGYALASKGVLQLSIVVLGTGLSLQQVVHVGVSSLPVMIGTLAVALGGAWLIGRALKLGADTRTLIGVGTGICGASAIAATTAVIRPKDTEVAYAIGTIFTFNIAAVLLFPPLGHLLGLSPHAFGLWSGTAVNDTSSVVAAAYAYGGDAGPYAIVVKLTRSLMIIPIVVGLAFLKARKDDARQDREVHLPWHRIVPLFLVGFVLAAATDTAGLIPDSWHPALSALGAFLITTALAGIGLSLRFADMRKAGGRPLLLGGLLWIAVAASSLGLQALTGL
jgi:uncharacterized integral membrane protein (TIGR00698 family)